MKEGRERGRGSKRGEGEKGGKEGIGREVKREWEERETGQKGQREGRCKIKLVHLQYSTCFLSCTYKQLIISVLWQGIQNVILRGKRGYMTWDKRRD